MLMLFERLYVQNSVRVALTRILFTCDNLRQRLQQFKTKATAMAENSENSKYVRVLIFIRGFPAFVIDKMVLPYCAMVQYYIYFFRCMLAFDLNFELYCRKMYFGGTKWLR